MNFEFYQNFLHTLEKDNKNRFEYFFALSELRIFKGIFDFGLPQKDISWKKIDGKIRLE